MANSHTLSYLIDQNNPDQATLSLIFPYEFYDSAGRPALTTEIILRLPTSSLQQVLEMIRANPDTLEQFYQTTTAGLDPSINRYKSSQVAIIDLETFMPAERFQGNVSLPQMVFAYPNRLNPEGMSILKYKTSHGSVDRTEIAERRRIELELAQQTKPKPPTTKPSSPKVAAQTLDNPSGLNPNAPLTKLVNSAIRLFRPKHS